MSLPNTERSLSISMRKSEILITPTYSPGRGTFIDKPPVLKSKANAPVALGKAIINALTLCEHGGEMPDFMTYVSPVVRASGSSSWEEYERNWIDCVLHDHGKFIVITSGTLIDNSIAYIKLPTSTSLCDLGTSALMALRGEKRRRDAAGDVIPRLKYEAAITNHQAKLGDNMRIVIDVVGCVEFHVPPKSWNGIQCYLVNWNSSGRDIALKVKIENES